MRKLLKNVGIMVLAGVMVVTANVMPTFAADLTGNDQQNVYVSSEEMIEMPEVDTGVTDELVLESIARGASKPKKTYDFKQKGKYSFTYSNAPSGFSRCWSRYKFTNCASTMYLKIQDKATSNKSKWYYEVYCNGKSIASRECKAGASVTYTIKDLKSTDKIWFYIAAGSEEVYGTGSLSSKK